MNPNTILPMVTKFQESRILLTAAEMDVFTLLENNPLSAGEIAEKTNATERGIAILLNAWDCSRKQKINTFALMK